MGEKKNRENGCKARREKPLRENLVEGERDRQYKEGRERK